MRIKTKACLHFKVLIVYVNRTISPDVNKLNTLNSKHDSHAYCFVICFGFSPDLRDEVKLRPVIRAFPITPDTPP